MLTNEQAPQRLNRGLDPGNTEVSSSASEPDSCVYGAHYSFRSPANPPHSAVHLQPFSYAADPRLGDCLGFSADSRRKPTLGKPLLVLRGDTERPEALEWRIARLVGGKPERLVAMLDEAYCEDSWVNNVAEIENPFGAGDGGKRIADSICYLLNGTARDLRDS